VGIFLDIMTSLNHAVIIASELGKPLNSYIEKKGGKLLINNEQLRRLGSCLPVFFWRRGRDENHKRGCGGGYQIL